MVTQRTRIAGTIALAIAACALAAGAVAFAWLEGNFLPSWTVWNAVDESIDLDDDGSPERVRLYQREVRITSSQQPVYTSPHEWKVQNVHLADINDDGTPEVTMLVWKRGSFGPSKPFWKEDNPNWSQHVFVLNYQDGSLVETWMSSAIGEEAYDSSMDGAGRLHILGPHGTKSCWEWNSWGFALVEDESTPTMPLSTLPTPSGTDIPASDNTQTVTFLALGDVIAHEAIYEAAHQPDTNTFDFNPLFTHIAPRVSTYDVAAVNQETILVHDPDLRGDFPLFATPESMGDALVNAGFDIVCAATNHANDRGTTGLDDTLAFWKTNYPTTVLLGLHEQPDEAHWQVMECNGINLALFDYTFHLNGRPLDAGSEFRIDTLDNEQRLLDDVAQAENEAELSICFVHIGEEYALAPTAEQVRLCDRLIDAGADAIICTHAHVAQPMKERTTAQGNTGIVFYSLGNLVSYQTEPDTILGAGAHLVIAKDATGTATITARALKGTVCHAEGTRVTAYFLEDYTDDLARRNTLATEENPITLAALQKRWHDLVSSN